MNRSTARHALPVLAAAFLLPGCGVPREFQEQYVSLKNDVNYQMVLLQEHNKFLEQKVDMVSEKIDRLEASEGTLARDITAFVARPDQVKREILGEVETRSADIARNQDAFLADFTRRLADSHATQNRDLRAQLDGMQAVIDSEDRFFRFVFAEQDSMNQVFASRFDAKPWYTSILARWEDSRSDTGN